MKLTFVVALLSALLLGVQGGSAEPIPNFMQRDLDGNGRLTPAEAGLSEVEFRRYDESNNGELSLGEFGQYWGAVAPQPTFSDLSYGVHPRHKLDLFLPPGAQGELPLVLWIHGGSWESGDKAPCPFKNLTESGVAVVALNYPLVPESRFPSQFDACRAALEWLKENQTAWGVRFSRTYAVGLSAGGHLSLLLGAEAGVDGVVGFAAPTDLFQPVAREHYRDTLENLVGSPLEKHEALLREASPMRVWSSAVPLLLFHGLEDRRVPYKESIELARVAHRMGSKVSLRLIPDGSHTVVGGPEGWRRMVEFFTGRGQ